MSVRKVPFCSRFSLLEWANLLARPCFVGSQRNRGESLFLFFMFSKLNCSITSNTVESKSSRAPETLWRRVLSSFYKGTVGSKSSRAPKTLWRRVLSSFYKGTVGSKSSSSSARNFFRGLTWYIRVNWVLPIFIIILPSFSWCYRVLPGIRGI